LTTKAKDVNYCFPYQWSEASFLYVSVLGGRKGTGLKMQIKMKDTSLTSIIIHQVTIVSWWYQAFAFSCFLVPGDTKRTSTLQECNSNSLEIQKNKFNE
jgi:hypothetical protein